jgi:uncharacterized protein (DUF885 family)
MKHFIILILISISACSSSRLSHLNHDEYQKSFTAFLEEYFEQGLIRNPEHLSYLGRKDRNSELADTSLEADLDDLKFTKDYLSKLQQYSIKKLNSAHQLNYRLLEKSLVEDIEDFKWRFHNYPVNQMFGRHSGLVSFMIDIHKISDLKDAQDYISRIRQFKAQLSNLEKHLDERKKQNILAASFVYPKAIQDSQNIITGQPFDKSKNTSPLWEDFVSKINNSKISSQDKTKLLDDLRDALISSVLPGFESLITKLTELEKIAPKEGGANKLPSGVDFYNNELSRTTTTSLTADEIHEIGINEVQRIHYEMNEIKKTVGFKGNLKDFFKYVKDSPRFYYPDNSKGKKQYLSDTDRMIKGMKKRLPEMFATFPKAELMVKPVEPYREASAGLAFYSSPAIDGSRPGIYYVNLYDMKAVNKFEMEALAYHEAIPGHHMQISIAQELEGVPTFRKFSHYTAFTEGWGLYAEYLPKEFGFYKDPYSDFGRLSMELWRAARLVVDTGLHAKNWKIADSIKWLNDNTPSPDDENERAIQRYIVMPAQATAYKIGMLKILKLREDSKKLLGKKFNIKEFHDIVLKNGSLPLDILEENVKAWTNRTL